MPQLDSGGGGAGGGDDLGAPDELLAFQDEGEEQDDKSRDSAAGPERDLAELKSSLVNESEGAAGDAGVPGAGAGARGEAEVGAEVSSGPRPVAPPKPPRSIAPGARLALPRPSLPRLSGVPIPQTPPVPGPEPPAFPALSRPLWISPQALGREHTRPGGCQVSPRAPGSCQVPPLSPSGVLCCFLCQESRSAPPRPCPSSFPQASLLPFRFSVWKFPPPAHLHSPSPLPRAASPLWVSEL